MCHYYMARSLQPVEGSINVEKYQQILDDDLWPVKAQPFQNERAYFEMTMH
jgi:hypothetical protein